MALALAVWAVVTASFRVTTAAGVPPDYRGLLYVAVDLAYEGRVPAQVRSVELLQPQVAGGLAAVVSARAGGGITDHLPPEWLRDSFPVRMTQDDWRQFIVPVQVPSEPGEYVRVRYSVLGIPRVQLLPAKYWLGKGESPFR